VLQITLFIIIIIIIIFKTKNTTTNSKYKIFKTTLVNNKRAIHNFDVANRDKYFATTTAVISNSDEKIIINVTQKLSNTDALIEEAYAALLTIRLAAYVGIEKFLLEGDACL
jgi:hypothetical protein